jgi:phage shock protein PspC (stress-responsive transcriptional regulator)
MNATTQNPAAETPATEIPATENFADDDHAGSGTTSGATSESRSDSRPGSRALQRPVEDRMLAGVAAGIAHYLGVDVTIVRIAIAVLTVAGGAGLPLYLAGWLLIPEEGCAQSLAEEFIQNWRARSDSY